MRCAATCHRADGNTAATDPQSVIHRPRARSRRRSPSSTPGPQTNRLLTCRALSVAEVEEPDPATRINRSGGSSRNSRARWPAACPRCESRSWILSAVSSAGCRAGRPRRSATSATDPRVRSTAPGRAVGRSVSSAPSSRDPDDGVFGSATSGSSHARLATVHLPFCSARSRRSPGSRTTERGWP